MTADTRRTLRAMAFWTLGSLIQLGLTPAQAGARHDRFTQLVTPGESIQAAIDRAAPSGWIFVQPGVYRETADSTNGLNISSPLHLIGLSTSKARVVLENAGGQSNGMVVVPGNRTRCMTCHASLAPPFELLPGLSSGPRTPGPKIRGVTISGITIRNFVNNGLFTENLDGFLIDDVASVGNKNYGIFPTLSTNGVVSHNHVTGSDDAGLWVETSENVSVVDNLVEGNVIGMEVSNSLDIQVTHNESRNNSVGIGVFLLPGLFEARPGAKRINLLSNSIHDNNKENTARAGALAADLPSGTGVLYVGADESRITGNRIENNNLIGVGVVDVCLAFAGGSHDCTTDPQVTPAFLADEEASSNSVVHNIVLHNGMGAAASSFSFAASDLGLLSFGAGNCFAKNAFATTFSIVGELPPCP